MNKKERVKSNLGKLDVFGLKEELSPLTEQEKEVKMNPTKKSLIMEEIYGKESNGKKLQTSF